MNVVSATQAAIMAVMTPAPAGPATLGIDPFVFWTGVVGAVSGAFSVVITVFAIILGLLVWRQNRLQDKAEKENESIARIAKDMADLRDKHQQLFEAKVIEMKKQIEEVSQEAKKVKTLASTTEASKRKVDEISREIERKANNLRGSLSSLVTVSPVGTISAPGVNVMPYSEMSPSIFSRPLRVGDVPGTLGDVIKVGND